MLSHSKKIQNIVFIVHYFPPINSSGAKRVQALSKYFAEMGRTVTVLTTVKSVNDGKFTEEIPSGIKILELSALGSRVSTYDNKLPTKGPVNISSLSRVRRIKDFVMAQFGQLPDPRIPFAIGFLNPFLAEEVKATLRKADVVISSMPPWPMHLASLFIRWRFKSRIVLDYRDQFSFNHIMPGTSLAKSIEYIIDKVLCRYADKLVVVSEPMAEFYRSFNSNVHVILNGYDPQIINKVSQKLATKVPKKVDGTIVVRYMGSISVDSMPIALLSGLRAAISFNKSNFSSVRFEFYGDCRLLSEYISKHYTDLASLFHFFDKVPHERSIELMLQSDYLLFAGTSARTSLSAQGVLTTKLFEYLACRRPILAEISATTEAGKLIHRINPSNIVSNIPEDFTKFFTSLEFLNSTIPTIVRDSDLLHRLSRKYQAEQYIAVLED